MGGGEKSPCTEYSVRAFALTEVGLCEAWFSGPFSLVGVKGGKENSTVWGIYAKNTALSGSPDLKAHQRRWLHRALVRNATHTGSPSALFCSQRLPHRVGAGHTLSPRSGGLTQQRTVGAQWSLLTRCTIGQIADDMLVTMPCGQLAYPGEEGETSSIASPIRLQGQDRGGDLYSRHGMASHVQGPCALTETPGSLNNEV